MGCFYSVDCRRFAILKENSNIYGTGTRYWAFCSENYSRVFLSHGVQSKANPERKSPSAYSLRSSLWPRGVRCWTPCSFLGAIVCLLRLYVNSESLLQQIVTTNNIGCALVSPEEHPHIRIVPRVGGWWILFSRHTAVPSPLVPT